jgi:alpha-glucoside transport system substrate-binding protein
MRDRRRGKGEWGRGLPRSFTTAIGFMLAFLLVGCVPAARPTSDTVRVLAAWSDNELDDFMAMVRPFEEQTGIRVLYTGTRDLRGVITDDLARGAPPDVAGLEGPGHMQELARAGALRDLAQAIDLRAYKQDVAPTFIELGSVDSRLVGLFVKATVKGLIWYDPRVIRSGAPESLTDLHLMAHLKLSGETHEWCIGLESKESSGWPGTDWVESLLLHRSGVDVYDRWVAGQLPWTSPEVRRAFEGFGQVVADDAVDGGSAGALKTYFGDAGDPLFARPPGCLFLHQGSFMPTFFESKGHRPGVDFDFFKFPEIDSRYTDSVIGAGDLFGLFTDNTAAEQLLTYLVSAPAQEVLVSRGGALSINQRVSHFPNALVRREAAVLSGANHFRFDASDMMPAALNAAFWQAILDFTADQSRLDDILAHLERLRVQTYG